MDKFPLGSVVFSTFLIVVCGAVSQGGSRTQHIAGPPTNMDSHMSLTRLRPLRSGDQARADAILSGAKKAAERYHDYRKAEADGYTVFMPGQHQNVYHFILEPSSFDDKERFDPSQPPGLLYTKSDGSGLGYKLVGVMYMARFGAAEEELDARIPLSIAQWHVHLNMCIPQQPEGHNWLMDDSTFGLNGSITTAEACTAAGGHFKPHLSGWMTHVYPFETDPAKIWSAGMGEGMEHNPMPGMKM